MTAGRWDHAVGFLNTHLAGNRRLVGVVALAFLAVSLFLPAVKTLRDPGAAGEWVPGFNFAAIGFLGPLEGQFGWFANPVILFLIACLLLNRQAHWLLGALAVLLVLSTGLFFRQGCADACEDVVAFGPGYYFWLASAALPMLTSLANRWARLSDACPAS